MSCENLAMSAVFLQIPSILDKITKSYVSITFSKLEMNKYIFNALIFEEIGNFFLKYLFLLSFMSKVEMRLSKKESILKWIVQTLKNLILLYFIFRSTTIKTMPSSTTTEDFPMLPTLNGFDGFSSNGFGMPELGLTSLFDLDQSREITKTSFTPTESMRDQEEEEIIELQEPENTRKTFSISRPRLTSDTKGQ